LKTDINIIKRLARMGVLDTEPVKYKKDDDIIIKNDMEEEQKVIIDNITDEDLPLLVAMKQLEYIKTIRSIVKFSFVCGLVAAGIWLLLFLISIS